MIVVFQRIGAIHWPLIFLARLAGIKVLAFDWLNNLYIKRPFAWAVRKGWVIPLNPLPLADTNSRAISAARHVGERLDSSFLGRTLETVVGVGEGRTVLRRALAEQFRAHFETALYMENVAQENSSSLCVFIDDDWKQSEKILRKNAIPPALLPKGTIIIPFSFFTTLANLSSNLVFIFMSCLRYFSQYRLRGREMLSTPPRPLGMLISSPFQVKFRGPRNFAFLIDGEIIKGPDVVFPTKVPLPPHVTEHCDAIGSSWVDLSVARSLKWTFQNRFGDKRFLQRLRHAIGGAFATLLSQRYAMSALRASIAGLIEGYQLAALANPRKYVYTNEESITQIAQNGVLRTIGIDTAQYCMFIGAPYQLHGPNRIFDERNICWSFLNPSVFFVNTEAMKDSFSLHHQDTKAIVIGNPFGELVKIERQKHTGRARKRIAIFDTTFIDSEVHTNFEDYHRFLIDIIRLAKERPGTDFLFKPSKRHAILVNPFLGGPILQQVNKCVTLRMALCDLPNMTLLDGDADPVDVIASSDVTVTHCFSSPTADALSGGAPGFWYESGSKWRGYTLDKVPGLCAHGYAELTAQLDICLESPTASDTLMLDPRAQDLLACHCSDTALTRLRHFLIGNPIGESAQLTPC